MSDLQIGLVMLGLLIVAGVLAFNWWQERKFRRRGEETFPGGHDDVLLGHAVGGAAIATTTPAAEPSLDDSRIEPRMEPRLEPTTEALPVAAERAPDMPRPEIDYIAELRAGELILPEKLATLQRNLPGLKRRISFGGLNYQTKAWEALQRNGRYATVRVALQLVDRSGPVSEEQLREFGDQVRNVATEISAITEMPDFAPALAQAVALDEFCADVDVVVGINVIANSGQVFPGTKIRALAESSGLHLQPNGVFHYPDEHGSTLFSLDNQESEPFLIDRIRNLTTPGITFLLDVPRVANGLRVFDRMVQMSRSFADSLGGTLADDNRKMLNDSGLDRIRAQLRAIYGAMEKHGFEAGSPLALRLFS